jgi:hypothetical protein
VEHTEVPLLIGEDRLEQTRFPCDAESLLERPCERTSPSKILCRVRLNQINASMSATPIKTWLRLSLSRATGEPDHGRCPRMKAWAGSSLRNLSKSGTANEIANGSLSLRLRNPCWTHIAFPAVTKEEYVGDLSARALSIRHWLINPPCSDSLFHRPQS